MKNAIKHYGKIFLNILIATVILLFTIFLLPRIIVFFLPFLIGWMISRLANPLVRFLEEKLKIRRKAGSAFIIAIVVAMISLLLYGIGALFVNQTIGFVENLPQTWESVESDLDHVGDNLQVIYEKLPMETRSSVDDFLESIQKYIGNTVSDLSSPTVEMVGNIAMNVPSVLISIIMCLLSAYFFIAEKDYMSDFLVRFTPISIREKWRIIYETLISALGGYLKAQLKIEIWMYLLLLIGLSIGKIHYAALVALGIAFLDILPIFGTGTVLVPWSVIKFLGGNYTTAVLLLILWGGGQLLRQLIQPRIVGKSLGLSSIPTLFLLYTGWKIGGVLGMILAVPIGIVILNLDRAGAFDTTKQSLKILGDDIRTFRRYSMEDYQYHEHYKDGRDKNENNRL